MTEEKITRVELETESVHNHLGRQIHSRFPHVVLLFFVCSTTDIPGNVQVSNGARRTRSSSKGRSCGKQGSDSKRELHGVNWKYYCTE